jgi:hypothetical protein
MLAIYARTRPSRSRRCAPGCDASPPRPGPPSNVRFLERTVNGQPGLVAQQNGVTVTVFAFHVARGRITHIWAVRNPGKLRPWTTG